MAPPRPFPPSAQRIAEARQSGHVPRPLLVGLAAGFIAVTGGAAVVGPRLAASLQRFLRGSLEALAQGEREAAYGQLAALLGELTGLLALVLALLFAGLLLGCAVAQGKSFGFSRATREARFPKPAGDRTASVLFVLGLWACVGAALVELRVATVTDLGELGASLGRRVVLLALATAIVDGALARARFFESLFMSRREQLDEQRAAFGAPELRTARRRLRREHDGMAASALGTDGMGDA